jgi:hypothetical protein
VEAERQVAALILLMRCWRIGEALTEARLTGRPIGGHLARPGLAELEAPPAGLLLLRAPLVF